MPDNENLNDLELGDIQELIEEAIQKKDKKRFKELSKYYNNRVGFKAYIQTLS